MSDKIEWHNVETMIAELDGRRVEVANKPSNGITFDEFGQALRHQWVVTFSDLNVQSLFFQSFLEKEEAVSIAESWLLRKGETEAKKE